MCMLHACYMQGKDACTNMRMSHAWSGHVMCMSHACHQPCMLPACYMHITLHISYACWGEFCCKIGEKSNFKASVILMHVQTCTQHVHVKACIHCTQVPETSFDLLFLEQITQLLCIGVPETFAVCTGLYTHEICPGNSLHFT